MPELNKKITIFFVVFFSVNWWTSILQNYSSSYCSLPAPATTPGHWPHGRQCQDLWPAREPQWPGPAACQCQRTTYILPWSVLSTCPLHNKIAIHQRIYRALSQPSEIHNRWTRVPPFLVGSVITACAGWSEGGMDREGPGARNVKNLMKKTANHVTTESDKTNIIVQLYTK